MQIDELKKELNKEQFEAVTTLEGPLLIIAGAGSGKTRVITYRIAHMLESGIPQSQILNCDMAIRPVHSRKIHQWGLYKINGHILSSF